MPATLLCARFTDQELALRKQARTGVRPTLPNPAATARALALAICEVEAGLRSASQLERICHPSLRAAVADRIQRVGGPPVSATSVLRVQVQDLQPGLVDAVVVLRRGQRVVFIALRLEAVPGQRDHQPPSKSASHRLPWPRRVPHSNADRHHDGPGAGRGSGRMPKTCPIQACWSIMPIQQAPKREARWASPND